MSHAPAVDVHTHLAPLLDVAALPPGVSEAGGQYEVDGQRVGPPALYDPPQLVNWIAQVSLDQAWVSIPPPFFRVGLDEAAAHAWVRAANDGILARTTPHPELEALVYLALDHPEVALAELARFQGDPQVTGWVAAAGGGTLPLDDPGLVAVWTAVERSHRPVLLHPGASPDTRLDVHYLANLLGNPVETTIAAAQLVFGNVLSRHPELRPVLVHCGGAVPALVGRWQRGLDTARPGVGPLGLTPRQAVQRFYTDALAHDPGVVDLALAMLGQDRVVLGSDWPFPMGLDDPATAIAHRDPDLRERVARTNPLTLRGSLS